MRRYGMFHFDTYYPSGGARDMGGSYDTILACVKAVTRSRANMLDTVRGDVIDVPTNLGGDALLKWARSQDRARKVNQPI